MARKNCRRSCSGGPMATRKSWTIAQENMGIEPNFFLAVKGKTMRNGHGRVVARVP